MSYRHRLTGPIVLALFACGGMAQTASAQGTYSITDLGTLPSFNASEASGINVSTQVSGTSSDTINEIDHAIVWSSGGGLVDLGTMGFQNSAATGINGSGQVVGEAYNCGPSSCQGHAFLWTSGTGLADIHTSTSFPNSDANGINTAGVIVGDLSDASGSTTHAFLWTSAAGMTDLGPMPGLTSSSGAAINDAGQVVGGSWDDVSGVTKAFVWTSAAGFTDLGTLPGFTDAEAVALNANGDIVGEASTDDIGPVHGFLLPAGGTMMDLGTLAGLASVHPHAMNSTDVVVGEARNDPNPGLAFIWTAGVMTDLNTLIPAGSGWVLVRATGINDAGQIVGRGTIGGQTHAFLLTPNP